MLWATALLTLLTGALTWWMLLWQLSPLLKTAHQLTLLANTNRPAKHTPYKRSRQCMG
jgi:hypothetical protein